MSVTDLRRSSIRTAVVSGAILMATLLPVRAAMAQQIPFSQRASVGQTVGFTHISMEYGRPTARGRVIFGDSGIVKWDKLWHPGADSASRITFDHEVTVEGVPLPAGEYTLWTLPRANGRWTVIVSRAAHVFHTPYPGTEHDALRVDVTAERGGHMESLAWYFPAVLRDEATLRLHWGEVIVPLRIKAPFRPQ